MLLIQADRSAIAGFQIASSFLGGFFTTNIAHLFLTVHWYPQKSIFLCFILQLKIFISSLSEDCSVPGVPLLLVLSFSVIWALVDMEDGICFHLSSEHCAPLNELFIYNIIIHCSMLCMF